MAARETLSGGGGCDASPSPEAVMGWWTMLIQVVGGCYAMGFAWRSTECFSWGPAPFPCRQ